VAAPDAHALQEVRGDARMNKLGEHVTVAKPHGRCEFSILPLLPGVEATMLSDCCRMTFSASGRNDPGVSKVLRLHLRQ